MPLEINLSHIMFGLIRTSLRLTRNVENIKCFHTGGVFQGFNEFYDVKVPGEVLVTGRAWTLADVRRKVRVISQQSFIFYLYLESYYYFSFNRQYIIWCTTEFWRPPQIVVHPVQGAQFNTYWEDQDAQKYDAHHGNWWAEIFQSQAIDGCHQTCIEWTTENK